MAARSSVISFAQCRVCRHNVLNIFATISGLTTQPVLQQRACRNSAYSQRSSRQLSTPSASYSEIEQHHQGEEQKRVLYQPFGSTDPPQEELEQSETTPLPWYLQVQGPQRTERSLSDRQRLPDLPAYPPPLLQPILEHVSTDLGIDDLLLFDLRKLDPPPALGANLVMIMGTARSEKHLHVSADRFCRWLRTEYRMTPYADGLLGRNELKLKMRRKARRTKLLSNVGSSDKSDMDDGIRTGWVCVNVGIIDDAQETVEKPMQTDDFVGFGGQTGGVKLVIQMMTESKREELDLEALWGGAVARQERKEIRDAAKFEESQVMKAERNEE